jgi:hypothetical protein
MPAAPGSSSGSIRTQLCRTYPNSLLHRRPRHRPTPTLPPPATTLRTHPTTHPVISPLHQNHWVACSRLSNPALLHNHQTRRHEKWQQGGLGRICSGGLAYGHHRLSTAGVIATFALAIRSEGRCGCRCKLSALPIEWNSDSLHEAYCYRPCLYCCPRFRPHAWECSCCSDGRSSG